MDFLTKENIPAICTPLTGKTKTEVLDQLQAVCLQEPDIIEWRADFLENLANTDEVLHIIHKIKATTKIPLLFTIRAEHEGGERISLSKKEKIALFLHVCEETDVDAIDYETSNDKAEVVALRSISKETNKTLILSYHHFEQTPPNEELMERAHEAEALGADVVKLAVMPESKADVLRLLELTRELDVVLGIPIVTMSMGDLGGLSRIIGWAYGSVLTFGVGVELSAPGQMPVAQLRKAIQQTQKLIPNW